MKRALHDDIEEAAHSDEAAMDESDEMQQVDLFLENQAADDYLEIKNLLMHGELRAAGVNLSAFTELLTGLDMGSVIKTETGEVFGFCIPVDLDLLAARDRAALTAWAVGLFRAHRPEQAELAESVLAGRRGRTMLLANERVVNCPTDLTYQLHAVAVDETKMADTTAGASPPAWVVLVAKAVQAVGGGDEDESPLHRRKRGGATQAQALEYILGETEAYAAHAEALVTGKVGKKARWTLGGDVQDFAVVAIVPYAQMPAVLEEIGQAYGISEMVEL